jgi:myb proto-oncogene protein
MFEPDLASPKRPSKVYRDPVESGRTPAHGDDDSIKEDCDGNEVDGMIIKGPWAEQEDKLLRALVAEFGAKRWSSIAAKLPGRIGKQARPAPDHALHAASVCAHPALP